MNEKLEKLKTIQEEANQIEGELNPLLLKYIWYKFKADSIEWLNVCDGYVEFKCSGSSMGYGFDEFGTVCWDYFEDPEKYIEDDKRICIIAEANRKIKLEEDKKLEELKLLESLKNKYELI